MTGCCGGLKAWHLYTHALQGGMGKGRKNKVLKLTAAKVNYIIREKPITSALKSLRKI
jgi:hypothetical protein